MRALLSPLTLLCVSAVFVAAAPSQAQQNPQTNASAGTANQPAPAAALIEGTVTRASDGQPLKRARIMVMPQNDPRAMQGPQQGGRRRTYQGSTDASGKFSIGNIEPGRYRLTVDRQGYVRAEYGQRAPGRPGAALTLDPGQKMRDLVFRLLDDGVITGRVTDEDGEPVIGGFVQVLRISYQRGQKQFVPTGGAQTNDKGEYRVFGLVPGRYFLSATASPQAGGPGGGRDVRIINSGENFEEVYAPSYYPGTHDPQNATALPVGPGEELAGIDLSIAPQRAYRVRGRITPPPPSASAGPDAQREIQRRGGIQASLMRKTGSNGYSRAFAQQANVDFDQGTFEFRAVLPGSYVLHVFSMDGRRPITHREPLEVGRGDVEGVNIVMSAGNDISGKVRVEGAAGMDMQRLRVQAMPEEDIAGGAMAAVTAESSFTLQGISPGQKHFISVQGLPPGFYMKSAKIGGEEISETGMPAAGKAGTLEIVMSANGGRIEGTVLDSENLAATAVTVVLVPMGKRRENPYFYRTTLTDALGKFSLQGVPPGEYRIFAWDDVDSGAWQDPEFLAVYEERGTRVTVVEGAILATDVKLIR